MTRGNPPRLWGKKTYIAKAASNVSMALSCYAEISGAHANTIGLPGELVHQGQELTQMINSSALALQRLCDSIKCQVDNPSLLTTAFFSDQPQLPVAKRG